MTTDNSGSIGSQWDFMCTAITNYLKNKSEIFYCGIDELTATENVFSVPELRQLTSDWLCTLSESNNISLKNTNEFRSIGNQLYKNINKNGMKVVDFYTRAIFSAPMDSVELGLAHANRAAALMALEFHGEAYSDCLLARKHSYPTSKLYKVLWRQANCSIKLQNLNQLASDLNEINCILDELKIRHLHVEMTKKLLLEYERLKEDKINRKSSGTFLEKKLIEKNDLSKGRYTVTSDNIQADELIIKEKAFAFIPVYQKFNANPIDLHCQNCAATNIIPFPCASCKRASYCSMDCLIENKNIHRFECPGYKIHLWFEIGIAHLALRTLLCGVEKLVEKIKHLCNTTSFLAWNELFLSLKETDCTYGSVLKLVTNFDKVDVDDLQKYVLTAIMITSYLKTSTQFFDELMQNFPNIMSDSSWQIFIGAIITRHIGQLICNGHAICDYEITTLEHFKSSNRIVKGKLSQFIENQRLFTAIFPRISMFNHACNPNIRNKFNNNELMVYANRDINPGGEILNCYGPNSKLEQRNERQELLKQQYHFECDCLPCNGTDEDYIKSHIYLCRCNADVLILSAEKFWWRDCDEDGPPEKIICLSCSHQMKFDWLIHFRDAIHRWDYQINNLHGEFEESLLKAIAKYENAAKFMKGDINAQKLDMTNMLLKYIVQHINLPDFHISKRLNEIYDKIKKICSSSLLGLEYRFGRYSLEYISSLAAVMDISAVFDRPGDDLIELDAIDCLSDRTKLLFCNYLDDFFQKKS